MAKQKSSRQNEIPKKAEKRLAEREEEISVTPVFKDVQEASQELSIHRVELEMRNDGFRRSQEQLEELRSRYFDLYDHAPVGYLTIDMNGIISSANTVATRLLDTGRDLLVNMSLLSLVTPEYRRVFNLYVDAVLESPGTVQICEVILRRGRKSKSLFPATLQSTAVPIDGRTEIRMILTDITDMKQAEREAKAARDELEREVDRRTTDLQTEIATRKHTEEVLKERLEFERFLADLSGRFVNIPPEQVELEIDKGLRLACEHLHLDVGTLWQWSESDPMFLILTHLYRPLGGPPVPEKLDAESSFPWSLSLMRAGRICTVPNTDETPPEATHDQETWRYYGIKSSLTFPLSSGGGKLIGALSFNTMLNRRSWPEDLVTRLQLVAELFANALTRKLSDRALRDSEERLSLASDAVGVGLWILDVGTGRFWSTEKALALFDLPSDYALNWEGFLNLVYPQDRQTVLDAVNEALQSDDDIRVQYRIVTPNNNIRWISSRGRRRLSSSGKIERLMGVSIDISQRKVYETELKERLRFEKLLTDISARLAKATLDRIDYEVEQALGAALETLQVDRCGLLRSFRDRPVFQITHVASAEALPALPFYTDLRTTLFPHLYRTLVQGKESCVFTTPDELPAEASIDKQVLRQWGIQSAIIVPIITGGPSDLFIAVTMDRRRGEWSEEHLPRLRLLGEILFAAMERGRAEGELRERGAVLASVLSASPVGIAWHTADRIIQWVNEEVTYITQYRSDELKGQSSRIFYETEEQFLRIGEMIYGSPAGRRVLNTRWVRKDGVVRDVELRAAWVDARNISAGIVIAAQDITEKLRSQTSALEAQSTVTALIESTKDMIWTVDPQRFGLLTFNSALEEYFRQGIGLAITRDMNPHDMVRGPFTPEVAEKWCEFYQRALNEGPFTEEYWVSTGTKLVLLSFSLLKRNNVVFGISVFAKDITERKRMEESIRAAAEEWQATFDAVPDLIMMMDKDRRILRTNRAAFSFFSQHNETVVGNFCCILMHHEEQAPETCPVSVTLKTKRHEEAELYDEERKAWFHASADPILDDTGEIIRIIHKLSDITDRKRADMETYGARREMLRLERLLLMGELSASLAHELNQPLTSILSNARAALRFLEADSLTVEELKMILNDIVRDDKRAGDIIRSLRSMLKVEEGETEITETPVLLTESVALFNSEAILRNITVKTDFPAFLPPVKVNRVQIQQVLVNLMMNAAEAMENQPLSKRKMVIRAASVNSSNTLRVSVRDFGKGIEEADSTRLFEPFFTTKVSGMGMGLPLSRSIVEAHGGHIWAENEKRGGAVFIFDLPACKTCDGKFDPRLVP